MKIITVLGARPQFVKAAAVSRAIKQIGGITEIIVHTGQHFDANMSDVFFDEMEIPRPDHNLDINGVGHAAMTGRMLEEIEKLVIAEKPDAVVVYGDTNSTIAGALAAKKLHVKVVHIEAGLRSFNMRMPEEINRILTDRISDLLLCPTDVAVANLENEGFSNMDLRIVKNGDVMQDAAMYYSQFSADRSSVMADIGPDPFILCTLHRAENTDSLERLSSIVNALNEVHSTTKVVLPLHPRTRKVLEASDLELKVHTIDPVGYFDMIELLNHCSLVVTDSGGLQKEAFFFKKHCVTLRDETEWTELVTNGYNKLAGSDSPTIIRTIQEMMTCESDFNKDLYGNGNASSIVAEEILKLA